MAYVVNSETNGGVFIPQTILRELPRATGEQLKVALYVVTENCTAPAQIAAQPGMPAREQVEAILAWWADAGLLRMEQADFAAKTDTAIRDEGFRSEVLSSLSDEVHDAFGRALSPAELRRLMDLYLLDHFEAETIALCAHYLGSTSRHKTVSELDKTLHKWQEAGVHDAASAEGHLKLLQTRAANEESAAAVFNLTAGDLTSLDKKVIANWYEAFGFDTPIVAEAAATAGSNRTIKYVNGILKVWHSKGYTSLAQIRGGGTLESGTVNAPVNRKIYADDAAKSSVLPSSATQPAARRPIRIKRDK